MLEDDINDFLIEREEDQEDVKQSEQLFEATNFRDEEFSFPIVTISLARCNEIFQELPIVYSFDDVHEEYNRFKDIYESCKPGIQRKPFPLTSTQDQCDAIMKELNFAYLSKAQDVSPAAPYIENMMLRGFIHSIDTEAIKQALVLQISNIRFSDSFLQQFFQKLPQCVLQFKVCFPKSDPLLQWNGTQKKWNIRENAWIYINTHCPQNRKWIIDQLFANIHLFTSISFQFFNLHISLFPTLNQLTVKGWILDYDWLTTQLRNIGIPEFKPTMLTLSSSMELLFAVNISSFLDDVTRMELPFTIDIPTKIKDYLSFRKQATNNALPYGCRCKVFQNGQVLIKFQQRFEGLYYFNKLEYTFHEQRELLWTLYRHLFNHKLQQI